MKSLLKRPQVLIFFSKFWNFLNLRRFWWVEPDSEPIARSFLPFGRPDDLKLFLIFPRVFRREIRKFFSLLRFILTSNTRFCICLQGFFHRFAKTDIKLTILQIRSSIFTYYGDFCRSYFSLAYSPVGSRLSLILRILEFFRSNPPNLFLPGPW